MRIRAGLLKGLFQVTPRRPFKGVFDRHLQPWYFRGLPKVPQHVFRGSFTAPQDAFSGGLSQTPPEGLVRRSSTGTPNGDF
eukprot:1609972-Rhodomonas_salina.1